MTKDTKKQPPKGKSGPKKAESSNPKPKEAKGKRPVGRPFKFTPEELEEKIDDYFARCGIDEEGYPIEGEFKGRAPSVSSLALSLKTSRNLIAEYSRNDEFNDSIKNAKARVEAYLEWKLDNDGKAGTIFNLKNNFGWSDKVEVKETGNKKPHVVIKLPDNGRGKPTPKTEEK